MSIKSLADTLIEIRGMNLSTAMSEVTVEKISDINDELLVCTDVAQKAIFEKLDEATLVKFLLMIQKITTVGAVVEGDKSLLLADISGALQSYTQTVVLAAVGALIQDEIL